MHDYDFLILQPNEFENLTRDLLQKKENVFIESFTIGRDNGIDLRYASVSGGRNIIVQAKRYKDLNSLMTTLKIEVEKVKALNPSRYILSTSVGLTPGNKDAIKSLFSPYIQSTEDILGKDDLNNLLGLYSDVEKQYYKLWLGSTSVLESIIDKRIENWSTMELETTRKEISLYVMNESFDRANTILKDNRYVIISGIPGIGKTTLARMLAYGILASGYDEFIKMNSMDDGAQKLTKGRKQVFFYDDFLGHSFLEDRENGFEGKVLAFIDKVKREPDKLFILSTREYILSAAKRQFEGFSIKNIEFAKCTLDLSCYSEKIRASILYNHLAVAELPLEYIRALLSGRQYLKLIKHSNFNPRIIEAFLDKKLYLKETPQAFVQRFLDFFDHPSSVWDFAYKKMPILAQHALIIRASMGSDVVLLSDWHDAVQYFLRGLNHDPNYFLDEDDWENVIKDVLGTFVQTERKGNVTVFGFSNPSVSDYLFDFIRQHGQVQHDMIRYSLFFNQISDTFTDRGSGLGSYGRIYISNSAFRIDLIEAYNRHLLSLSCSRLLMVPSFVYRERIDVVRYINEIARVFPSFFQEQRGIFAKDVTQELLENEKYSLRDRMELLNKIDVSTFHIDLDSLIDAVSKEIEWSYDYVTVIDLFERTEKGRNTLKDGRFLQELESSINNEIEAATNEYELNLVRDNIEELSGRIEGFDAEEWYGVIDETSGKISSPEPEYDDWDSGEHFSNTSKATSDYFDMYSSLLEQELE